MNNVNVANMNAMAGAVGGAPMPMAMNNTNGPMAAAQQAAQRMDNTGNNRVMLNTYIYDYFLREGLYDCARALLTSDQPPNVNKGSPGSRRDENGNVLGNGVGDDAMDTDSKDDVDSKRPSDLPLPILSGQSETCFLYEWFCLFWDMLMSQRKVGPSNNPGANPQVSQYIQHAQLQNRQKQNHQQEMLRQMRPDGTAMGFNPMMRNGMAMAKQQNTLARAAMGAAMANNQNNPNMQMVPQKQGQMQRDPSDMDGSRRPASPGSAENAPSPNKRPRLEGNTPFNPQQAPMMPNGRPPQGMPGQQVSHKMPSSPAALHAQQLQLARNVLPYSLTPQQFYQNQQPNNQQKIASYQKQINNHHAAQINNGMGANPVPQGQGSPIMPNQPNGAEINTYYNAEGMGGPGGIRAGPGNGQGGGSNHALQDYQMQLMLLEQQNKKRLMMARQEQDSMGGGGMPRGDGPGGPQGPPGANGQPFPDASPQGARAGASPNPSEQMKRGTPQMNPAGIPSPLPEGAQSRGSPNPMNFMPNGMDPNMAPHFFKGNMNGMDGGNMVQPGMNNGMRPPSSHPGQPFNGQMNPQIMAARQAQQQQQGGPGGPQMQWQGGPNGANPMVQQQGPQGPVQGTPQQRAMPPPSAPGPGGNANARTQPSSPAVSNAAPPTPQQGNKPNPKKKDSKAAKNKAAAQKKANNNTGATPAAEPSQEPEPPTPATPITPVNPGNFAKAGPNAAAGQQVPNPQQTSAPPAQVPVAPPAQADHNMHQFGSMNDFQELTFADPALTNDVLNDFDFDSFLHDGDNDNGGFDFGGGGFMDSGEIGATD